MAGLMGIASATRVSLHPMGGVDSQFEVLAKRFPFRHDVCVFFFV